MTQKKQLKARVRARMARSGESYVTALRHVTSSGGGSGGGAGGDGRLAGAATAARGGSGGGQTLESAVVDLGYALRGGVHPESANVAHVLAHHGIKASEEPINEALVFGIGG